MKIQTICQQRIHWHIQHRISFDCVIVPQFIYYIVTVWVGVLTKVIFQKASVKLGLKSSATIITNSEWDERLSNTSRSQISASSKWYQINEYEVNAKHAVMEWATSSQRHSTHKTSTKSEWPPGWGNQVMSLRKWMPTPPPFCFAAIFT